MANAPCSPPPTAVQRAFLVWSPLPIGLCIPTLTLLVVQCTVGNVPLGTALANVWQKQFEQGHNLFGISLVGLIPFLVLTFELRGRTAKRTARACVAIWLGGLAGILALMIPAYVSVWYPLYGPGRPSSTGALLFLFVPFYCIVTLYLGLWVGGLVSRRAWFQPFPAGHCQRCGYLLRGNASGVCPECGTKPETA